MTSDERIIKKYGGQCSDALVHELIFDSHFHIIDPRFPLIENEGYIPSPFTVNDYFNRISGLNVQGGAVVSGSFQGFDQSYLIATLKQLGPTYVGVTQLAATASDEEILSLHAAGVCAVRFNLHRGGSEHLRNLERFAHRVYELVGWHVELYVANRDLLELEQRIRLLPKVSVDHLGLSMDGFQVLLRLVEQGLRVKATGFGRVDFNVPAALRDIWHRNQNSLLFGTDLPSTRSAVPFSIGDIHVLLDTIGDEGASRILRDNALGFYGVSLDRRES